MQTSYAVDDRVPVLSSFCAAYFYIGSNLPPSRAPRVVVVAILNNRLDQSEFRLISLYRRVSSVISNKIITSAFVGIVYIRLLLL
jgi:hypothetical protein